MLGTFIDIKRKKKETELAERKPPNKNKTAQEENTLLFVSDLLVTWPGCKELVRSCCLWCWEQEISRKSSGNALHYCAFRCRSYPQFPNFCPTFLIGHLKTFKISEL